MATKIMNDDFMSQVMNEEVWKKLSGEFNWTEQLLEKYQNQVDWTEVSGNNTLLWTSAMLEKFKRQIDWTKLSQTSHLCLLTPENLERFQSYWDWDELSENGDLKLNFALLDQFADKWNWEKIINRWYNDELYTTEFLQRYAEHIPMSELKNSALWSGIIGKKADALAIEITSK